jgi:hypothetical protein
MISTVLLTLVVFIPHTVLFINKKYFSTYTKVLLSPIHYGVDEDVADGI